MAKYVIDENDIVDATSLKVLERLSAFFDRLDDPYRMPQAMADWLDQHHENHQCDTVYSVNVGWGPMPLTLYFTFRRNMIVMEFRDACGQRLTEYRLHR